MRISRDARWVLGLIFLIGLGASLLRWRTTGAEQVGIEQAGLMVSLPCTGPRIAVLDERERRREIRDQKGRRYVLDDESLSVCGIRLGMTVAQVHRILGSQENCSKETTGLFKTRVLTWSARGVTVRLCGGGQPFNGRVEDVSGPSLESHGLPIARHSDARDVVKARLANAMTAGTLYGDELPDSARSTHARGKSTECFSTFFVPVWVLGPDSLQFVLGPRRSHGCGTGPLIFVDSSHPVDYANFMSLHGHPVEGWTPLPGCAVELTMNRYHDWSWK